MKKNIYGASETGVGHVTSGAYLLSRDVNLTMRCLA